MNEIRQDGYQTGKGKGNEEQKEESKYWCHWSKNEKYGTLSLIPLDYY